MRILKLLSCSILVLQHSFAGAVPPADSTNFFRMQNVYTTGGSQIFDLPQWTTHLDGPIRASAAFNGTNIFIGTAKGTFYAVDRKSGTVKWTFTTGSAIHSTAMYEQGKLYFTDNTQTLYCISAAEGKLIWKYVLGKRISWDWRFDYYYSSPVPYGGNILAGGDDGYMHCIDKKTGRQVWQYNAGAVVRATATIRDGIAYFGDCDGMLHAIDATKGTPVWKCATNGDTITLGGEWYFDRKSILGTVAVEDGLCVVGSRDGYVYAVDKANGKIQWSYNYDITWVISSLAIKDNMVIAGTSDGKFINALDLHTGKELWRYKTRQIVWASPTIINDLVYLPSNDGVMHILDRTGGRQVSEYRTAEAGTAIFSSPVFTGSSVVYGTDAGNLYALRQRSFSPQKEKQEKKYVFWMDSIAYYFRNGMDKGLKEYLVDNGYTLLDSSALIKLMQERDDVASTTIAFASNYFPDSLWMNERNSLLRKFLDAGGRVIIFGFNPIVYDVAHERLNFTRAKQTLDISYGPDDLRSFHGVFPAFPTLLGKDYFLPAFWTATCSVDKNQVDKVLGEDENGLASAWMKYYGSASKGALVQVWLDAGKPVDQNFIKFLKDVH